MTSREVVVNKALSGAELKQLVRADLDRMLDNWGEFSDYIAYGRCGYDIRIRLHTDNPMAPESEMTIASRPVAWNSIERNPALAALEAAPLTTPSSDESVRAEELHRSIDSPNAERIRNGIPVPVTVQQQDGTKITQEVKYPPQPDLGEGDVSVESQIRETRAGWGLPSEPLPLPATEPAPAGNLTGVCHCTHKHENHALSGVCTQCPKENPCTSYRDQSIALPNTDGEKWLVEPT